MKRIIFLLIILLFSNCRYFNVSPVDGIKTKELTEKPLTNDFVGTWEIDKYSYDVIQKNGYQNKNVKLSIKSDGSFEAVDFPNFIVRDVFSENKIEEQINAKGKWEIGKDFDGQKWALLLYFEKSDLHKEGLITQFDLYKENGNLILWNFVGDPDSGERLLFRKQ